MSTVTKSSLSPGRRRLLELMQRVNFGRIENLRLRDGDPVFDAPSPPRVVLELKFGAENGPRPEAAVVDFALKQQVLDLFAHFDRLRDARVEALAVKHGLPFGMHVEASV